MTTLTAIREQKSTYNCVTTLKDNQVKVKAVLTGYNQPKKSQKKIKNRRKIMKIIKTTNNKGKYKLYTIDKFINKLNKGLINIEGNSIEIVKAKLKLK